MGQINKPNPAIDQSGLPRSVADAQARKAPDQVDALEGGISCGHCIEGVPHFVEAECEQGGYFKGDNNTSIVLGRDRPAGISSGYGGQGDTQAGMIDLCVGRMAPRPIQEDPSGDRVYVDNMCTTQTLPDVFKKPGSPSIMMDAARIYISQKTDVDYNFKLVPGSVGSPNKDEYPKSAIALQADGIRIIGRENIKLVTHGPGSPAGVYNSQGGLLESVGGIDLIAGNNDEDLQPLVKGFDMVQCISEIFEQIDKLNGIVSGILSAQMKFNTVLTTHIHHSPFFGIPTSPSPTLVPEGINTLTRQLTQSLYSITAHKRNLSNIEYMYTEDSGPFYILSSYNNTN